MDNSCILDFITKLRLLPSAKEQEKSRSGISTPNRHLFLLLFIFTFNLRSVQKHHQQCPIFKNLDVVQRFQHEVRVHLRQRLCPISIFYELLCPITFQEVLALQLFRPLLHEILSVLHQCIPSHQISLISSRTCTLM